VAQEGDYHLAELSVDSKGKLSRIFESEIEQARLKVELRNGKVNGILGPKGNHYFDVCFLGSIFKDCHNL